MTYRVTVILDRADRSDPVEAQAVINEIMEHLKAMPGSRKKLRIRQAVNERSVKQAKTERIEQ